MSRRPAILAAMLAILAAGALPTAASAKALGVDGRPPACTISAGAAPVKNKHCLLLPLVLPPAGDSTGSGAGADGGTATDGTASDGTATDGTATDGTSVVVVISSGESTTTGDEGTATTGDAGGTTTGTTELTSGGTTTTGDGTTSTESDPLVVDGFDGSAFLMILG